MDKYGTENDPLCYPNSSVLINALGITDAAVLANAERDITRISASQIEFELPPYNLDYLCRIHKSLFGDIYAWAGDLREVDISKDGTHFCHVPHLQREASKVFARLAEDVYLVSMGRSGLVEAAAIYYGDLNMVHPFREGNGRAQRVLFEHLVVNAGYEISWAGVGRAEWQQANIASVVCDYHLLTCIFERCVGNKLHY